MFKDKTISVAHYYRPLSCLETSRGTSSNLSKLYLQELYNITTYLGIMLRIATKISLDFPIQLFKVK